MPATISSTFSIEYTQAAGTGTATITNPGRAFRVLSILGTGLNTSVITVRKNSGAGDTVGVCTLATGDLNDFPAALTAANLGFTASDNVHITIATADATKVTILCSAEGGGQSLSVA